jgi:hypothetical protein
MVGAITNWVDSSLTVANQMRSIASAYDLPARLPQQATLTRARDSSHSSCQGNSVTPSRVFANRKGDSARVIIFGFIRCPQSRVDSG